MKIPYTCHTIEPSKYKTSVGFDIETEWGIDDIQAELANLEDLV